MSILKLFLTSILFVSSGIACADYENTLKKAKQGDATAQNYLGVCRTFHFYSALSGKIAACSTQNLN